VRGDHPDGPAGGGGRGPVRRDLHLHRHGGGRRAHQRRAEQRHPGAHELGVLPRHRWSGRRPGGSDPAVPLPDPARRGDRDPAGGPADGGGLMTNTVTEATPESAVAALRARYRLRHVFGRIGVYVAAVLAALICAAPFLWSLITAFKQNRDLYNRNNNPFAFNRPATSDHVIYLFDRTAFGTFAWNTFWVGVLVVAITLLLGLPAAYALARLDRPWAGWFGVAIFLVYLVPPSLLFLSLSRVVVLLGLQDSTWSLVLIYPTITIPVSIWLMIGFLKAIPRDIEEQAMVDGHSR